MPDIAENLTEIRRRITSACRKCGRDSCAVELITVSKTFNVDAIREAHDAGQVFFGESRLQEAEPKIDALPSSIRWHFIGGVQRNKLRRILTCFEVVHAIDSLRLATHADGIAAEIGLYPKVFLQVNIAGEASKGGFEPTILRQEMESLLSLKRLEIIGLMTIPPAASDPEAARPWFAALRELRDSLERDFNVPLPCLSMGMSGDFEVAIEEGSTHVRVGSAIFGKRAYRVDGELG
jgi:PLP dependent protein